MPSPASFVVVDKIIDIFIVDHYRRFIDVVVTVLTIEIVDIVNIPSSAWTLTLSTSRRQFHHRCHQWSLLVFNVIACSLTSSSRWMSSTSLVQRRSLGLSTSMSTSALHHRKHHRWRFCVVVIVVDDITKDIVVDVTVFNLPSSSFVTNVDRHQHRRHRHSSPSTLSCRCILHEFVDVAVVGHVTNRPCF